LPPAYSGLLDLQVLLGLGYFLWTGLNGMGFPAFRMEHLAIMLVAAIAAHLPARWKTQEEKLRYRNIFLVVGFTLALIYVGVSILPGGWKR
jgi:multisubunit Na+/H+ antiporter MnhB subunit